MLSKSRSKDKIIGQSSRSKEEKVFRVLSANGCSRLIEKWKRNLKKKQLLHIGWTGNGSNMRSNMYVRLNVAKMFGATSSEGEF